MRELALGAMLALCISACSAKSEAIQSAPVTSEQQAAPEKTTPSPAEIRARETSDAICAYAAEHFEDVQSFIVDVSCEPTLVGSGQDALRGLDINVEFGDALQAFETDGASRKVLYAVGDVKFRAMRVLHGVVAARDKNPALARVRIRMTSAHGSVEHTISEQQLADVASSQDEKRHVALYQTLGPDLGPQGWIVMLLWDALPVDLRERLHRTQPPSDR